MSDEWASPIDGSFWTSRGWWLRAGHTTAAVWIGTGLAFVATLIAARNLGPGPYGSAVLALALAAFIFTLLDLTLDEAVVFHGSQLLETGRASALPALIRSAVTIDFLNGVIVLVLVLGASEIGGRWIADAGTELRVFQAAALATFFTTIDGTTGAVLLLAGRPEWRAWLVAWVALLRICSVLVAVLVGITPVSMVAAFGLAALLGSISMAFIAWRVVRRRWLTKDRPTEVERWAWPLARFGFHTALTTSIQSGRGSLIPVVVGRAAGVEVLGLYTVGMLPVAAAGVATSGLRMSLYPEQARLAARNDWRRLRSSILGHTWIGLALGGIGAILGFFLLPWLIPALYSSAFEGSVDPARILLIAAALSLAFSWAKTLPAAVGRPALRTAVASIDLAITVVLIWGFAERGAEGVALATSISVIVLAVAWSLIASAILKRMRLLGTGETQETT